MTYIEPHFSRSGTVRDVVIGMAAGVAFATAKYIAYTNQVKLI